MRKVSLQEYFHGVKNNGFEIQEGTGKYFWIRHEKFSVIRFPEFCLSVPTAEEIKKIFRQFKCAVISYSVKPDNPARENSILYNSHEKYDINALSASVRRNIRYGRRNLIYGFAEWDEILKGGLKAFADTRTRTGLSDGTEKNFKKRFEKLSRIPGHMAAAARLGSEIIAFLSLIAVEDFVIIQGTFSVYEYRKYRSNNVLVDFVLDHFLNENNFRLVCYGLSSIQADTGKEGLHQYKTGTGFKVIPVQRVFLMNPLISPFEKPLKHIINFSLKYAPENRTLRKAAGLFNFLEN